MYCDSFDLKLKEALEKQRTRNISSHGNSFSFQFAHSIHQLLWEHARGNEILLINQALRTVFVHC